MNITKCIDSSGQTRVAVVEDDRLIPLQTTAELPTLSAILASENPKAAAESLARDEPIAIDDSTRWLPPIDQQEVWAAGVTYKRSQTARMEESEAAASCYDQVYNADRPEIFFKATPSRVSGHGQPLRIRVDAKWNVPEPEITLVLSPSLKIVGLTVGNDMSSRDIEGENPLYLPQAKCYDQCAGLGPWITLFDELPSVDAITVDLKILRGGDVVFDQSTSAAEMARKFDDLVQWLGRDNTMADGAFLMTGTGIVPTSDFTLHPDDVVNITIGCVGTLSNRIVQGPTS
ncbi:fumarylacetoacetate hydrolase family protein [Rhodopirellula sp. JC740]|uniref:Fumarylacetoacetate hydrolase family protein n=1 Tax=Rhodopirellula halodulae TaxID=2894198 RepID=A0ABS8NJX3_9BACT|nr:fumarylacetoacetate hydrolase family protein [Rhodopirellula sp. JC740]MCC9643868.1 fumarylacetoacetate hydrolase family protein [Rhodopirellula sp. JC740]